MSIVACGFGRRGKYLPTSPVPFGSGRRLHGAVPIFSLPRVAIRKWGAEELADNRNLCGAVVAVAGGLAGLAQAVEAPIAARIVFAVVASLAALAGLCFHLLERRASRRSQDPLVLGRVVPRA